MGKAGHYYTPAKRIAITAGVKHRPLDSRADIYAGTADALVASDILRTDMLPADGRGSLSWRPTGVEREQGQSWCYVPGYLQVSRHFADGFRVIVAVSREEQAIRKAEENRRHEQRMREWNAENAKREAELAAMPQPVRGSKTEEDFRYVARIFSASLRRYLIEGFGDGGPFSYALDDDDREAVGDALDYIDGVVASGTLAIDRAKTTQVAMQQKGDEARADKPLQMFLATVNGKAVRRKPA
jgi:hypothetical protein